MTTIKEATHQHLLQQTAVIIAGSNVGTETCARFLLAE